MFATFLQHHFHSKAMLSYPCLYYFTTISEKWRLIHYRIVYSWFVGRGRVRHYSPHFFPAEAFLQILHDDVLSVWLSCSLTSPSDSLRVSRWCGLLSHLWLTHEMKHSQTEGLSRKHIHLCRGAFYSSLYRGQLSARNFYFLVVNCSLKKVVQNTFKWVL